MKITSTLLKRPIAALVLAVALCVSGWFSLTQLDVDYLPEITYPLIKIHIWWRGATPDEIETNVAEPIERVLATVDNLDYLESSSIEGMYTLLVNFRYGVEVDAAYQDVLAAMGRVARKLPRDMDPPVIIKADPSALPVLQVTVTSDQRDLVWLREWADNWLTDRLTAVPGTAGVEVVGGLEREIRVNLDPQRLLAYRLGADQVMKILAAENRELFAGRVTVETREIIARTMGEFESLREIGEVVVGRNPNGGQVHLRDVAEIIDSHEEMRVNTRFNGSPCIKLNVLKQAEANTVSVARAVQKRLQQLRADIPADVRFGFVENQGDYVMGAIRSVENSAILAAVLVILVVYLFLGRWRQVLVMLVALPITLLTNFLLMKMADFSINLFSLGGLVVALGVILDNSIVVLENITRLKHQGVPDYALRGTFEVGPAIIAATLTFLAIFLPFLFVPGLASLLFKELVLVVAGIVIVSLLVAVTFTPLLTDRLLRREKAGKPSAMAAAFDRMMAVATSAYRRLLALCLEQRVLVVIIFAGLLVAGIVAARRTGTEFLPKVDDGRVMVKVKMPSGTSVGEVDAVLGRLEAALAGMPEIESIFTLAGGKVWGLYTYEIANEGELDIQLVPKAQRKLSTRQFIAKIKPIVKNIPVPGGKVPVMQMKVKGIRKMGEQEVEVKVRGTEVATIFDFAKRVAGRLRQDPGLTNINVSMDMSKPEYRIHVDRARASALGIRVGDVASVLRNMVNGVVATQYREGSEYYAIRVLVPPVRIASRADLENLVFQDENHNPVLLKEIADVRRASGPVEIVREDQAKQVIVRADANGISVGEAVKRAEKLLAGMQRPSGVEWEMGGQAQMMAENRRTTALVLGFALLFAFVVLAIQFESLRLPFLILANVPLALTGAFLALWFVGMPIGVTVFIGLVVMMGGITSQGVVLLSLAEQYRKDGAGAGEAVWKAAPIRLRPILMTQLTTVLGLVPLALNLGEGGDMLQPMAIAVIGGLVYSLLLTLLFLPCLYMLVYRDKAKDFAAVAVRDETPSPPRSAPQPAAGQRSAQTTSARAGN